MYGFKLKKKGKKKEKEKSLAIQNLCNYDTFLMVEETQESIQPVSRKCQPLLRTKIWNMKGFCLPGIPVTYWFFKKYTIDYEYH